LDDDKPEVDDNAQTIRPNRSPSSAGSNTLCKAPPADIAPIFEDYSDVAIDEDDEWQEKFADFKMKNTSRRGLFHPDDIKTLGLAPSSPGPKTAPLPELKRKSSKPSLSPMLPSPGFNGSASIHSHGRSSSYVASGSGSFGRSEAHKLYHQNEFGKYTEDDDEDYDDVFGKPNGACMSIIMSCV
jgi:hypothetical protein